MLKRVRSPLHRLLTAGLLALPLALAGAPGAAAGTGGCHPDADELRVTFQPVDHSIVTPSGWRLPAPTPGGTFHQG